MPGVKIKRRPHRLKLSPSKKLKLMERRPTKAIKKSDLSKYLDLQKWWQKPSIIYAFGNPYVRSRLEKLMGSNRVSLTDRQYMIKLQERILEDYAQSMSKRIKAREMEEMERVKNLVLTGKIPIDEAPPEMANHPVMLIEMYCRRLIAERRAKIKVLKVNIPTHLYSDDTPDPPSGLSIEKGHIFRKATDRLCTPPEGFLAATDEEDVEAGYMFTEEEYELIKYENELIKELRKCETVEEMYALADEIIGALQTIDEAKREEDTLSTVTNITAATAESGATTASAATAATAKTTETQESTVQSVSVDQSQAPQPEPPAKEAPKASEGKEKKNKKKEKK